MLEQRIRTESGQGVSRQTVIRAQIRVRGEMSSQDLQSSKAVLAALKGLQDKVRHLEEERRRSIEDAQMLKAELERRREYFGYTQQLQDLTMQEQSAAARLSYERLLADKRSVDNQLEETEELKHELKETSQGAHDQAQDAHVAQLAAEAKVSILEKRVKECQKLARARSDRCLRARKSVHRDTEVVNSQLRTLAASMKKLQRTLGEERSARQLAETKHRRAENTTARTSRYLDSILQVNQELVATRTGLSTPQQSVARQCKSWHGAGELSRLRPRKSANNERISEQLIEEGMDGLDIAAAVVEVLRTGQAGRDPVLYLQALYERVGFCALQERNGDEGMTSLPTSPSRTTGGNIFEEGQCWTEGEGFSPNNIRANHPKPLEVKKIYRHDRVGAGRSPGCYANARHVEGQWSRAEYGEGGRWNNTAAKGYSFAHSPQTKPVSVAERSPQVVQRLETLESQLERERADVEQWYKTVLHRASSSAHGGGRRGDLDAKSLTRAIASLQEKVQQLEVVRESLEAFNATPQTSATSRPTGSRRKMAALHVLQGLCEDIARASRSGASAS